MNGRNMWIDIITKLYKNLHMSKSAMYGMSESDKKRDKILNYFDRLEKIHKKVALSKNENDLKILKYFYYNLYVIKPEDIPESYFEHEKRIMRERGYGNIEINSERKEMLIKQIISDQKESLDQWIEYFLFDEESESYEMWEKYWVFQGLQQLGKYNKETSKFSKRDKHTVYPFPPVEREAIFNTLKLMEEYIKDKKGDNEIRSALGSGNFKTLYEYSIKMIMNKGEKQNNTTLGKWIKYEQGSDYHILRDSLQGYYTGWCTAAGENFASMQLENGDFYVYYTLDENGEAKVPRIAIRMDGHNKIGEIRGIASNQNMEPEMMPILDKKLEEFPDRDKYRKKEYDMQFLTTIDNKVQRGYDLTKEELRFLYEIDDKIEGFGYEKDPRIEEIKSKRNLKKDYACMFECRENQVSDNIKDIYNEDVVVFIYDNLEINDIDIDLGRLKYFSGNIVLPLHLADFVNKRGLKLPKHIGGNLDLRNLRNSEGLKLPEYVGGSLYLSDLVCALNLKLPEYIGGNIDLDGLKQVKELRFPKVVNGFIWLGSMESAEDIELPEVINGNLTLNSLKNVDGLKLPNYISGVLNLSSIEYIDNLKFPEYVGGYLDLRSLVNAKGLEFPQEVRSDLMLGSLEVAEDLKFPDIVGYLHLENLRSFKNLILPKTARGIFLDNIVSAEGLEFPESVDELDLKSLRDIKGLELPELIYNYLNLSSLRNAEGLRFPEDMLGSLYLNSLMSSEGLKLPENVDGDLNLESLKVAEGLKLPENVGGNLDLSSAKYTEGLIFPKSVGGTLDLSSLERVDKLELPECVEEDLDLSSLIMAKKLKLPENVGGNLYLNNLISAFGVELPDYVGRNLDLSFLSSAEGLKLPENICSEQLIIDDEIMEELEKNPEKYLKIKQKCKVKK